MGNQNRVELLRNPKEGCGRHSRKFLGGEEVMESSKQTLFSDSAGFSVRY